VKRALLLTVLIFLGLGANNAHAEPMWWQQFYVQFGYRASLGLDRMCAILAGESSIREVMAFPKTATAVDLMSGAPSPVDPSQLRELHLSTRK
jgi:hypothetical protein